MKSIMKHAFSLVPKADIPRSRFDRNHRHLTTFDAGYLVPVYCDEVLPGDTFNIKMTYFARLATPIAPIMDNIYMDSFFFFVPYRLIWSNFKKMMGEQVDPGDSIDYSVPTYTNTGQIDPDVFTGSDGLFNYLGIPVSEANVFTEISALPARAYNLIWNEWFRDQNMQDSVVVDIDDGPDDIADYIMLKRGKRHDYFTSCLPWPVKSDEVTVPWSESELPIRGLGKFSTGWQGTGSGTIHERDGATSYADWQMIDGGGGVNMEFGVEKNTGDTYPNLRVDLSEATVATINTLRLAFQLQKLMERDARGGTRYTEIVQSHFGVTSPDARLQRPEYLGGGSKRVNVHPVPQTSETNTTPQGNMSAFATVSGRGDGFVKSFTEHGVVIGMVSARADLTYQQGLNRMWSRSTRYDFYWPELSRIGEQAVLNKEIYFQDTSADEEVFGYQERFAEYRYKPSMVTGLFRSAATSSLDLWHLSQEFGSLPALGDTFIQEDPPIDRVIATPAEPHFIMDAYFELNCARPMPLYGVPGLIDHF